MIKMADVRTNPKNSSEGCNGGIEHCYISPNGYIRPHNYTDYTFGTLYKKSIFDIWNSQKAFKYRNCIPITCRLCSEFQHCRGGEWVLNSQNELLIDPLMKNPINDYAPETYEFDPEFVPIPRFKIREESLYCLATRYNWSVPFGKKAKIILNEINGINSLGVLQNLFGDIVLIIIGILFKEKCIEFGSEDF